MVSFYYAFEFLPFIIDTVVYATILIIALNIVLKDSKKLNDDENTKRKFYIRLVIVLLGAPLLTGFLYSAFNFNLGMIFAKEGLWLLAVLFGLLLLIPILLAVFKKLPSVKGLGWLWWFVPTILIPVSIVAFREHPKIRDFTIYFSIFFLLFVMLFWLARDKREKLGSDIDKLSSRRDNLVDKIRSGKLSDKEKKKYADEVRGLNRKIKNLKNKSKIEDDFETNEKTKKLDKNVKKIIDDKLKPLGKKFSEVNKSLNALKKELVDIKKDIKPIKPKKGDETKTTDDVDEGAKTDLDEGKKEGDVKKSIKKGLKKFDRFEKGLLKLLDIVVLVDSFADEFSKHLLVLDPRTVDLVKEIGVFSSFFGKIYARLGQAQDNIIKLQGLVGDNKDISAFLSWANKMIIDTSELFSQNVQAVLFKINAKDVLTGDFTKKVRAAQDSIKNIREKYLAEIKKFINSWIKWVENEKKGLENVIAKLPEYVAVTEKTKVKAKKEFKKEKAKALAAFPNLSKKQKKKVAKLLESRKETIKGIEDALKNLKKNTASITSLYADFVEKLKILDDIKPLLSKKSREEKKIEVNIERLKKKPGSLGVKTEEKKLVEIQAKKRAAVIKELEDKKAELNKILLKIHSSYSKALLNVESLGILGERSAVLPAYVKFFEDNLKNIGKALTAVRNLFGSLVLDDLFAEFEYGTEIRQGARVAEREEYLVRTKTPKKEQIKADINLISKYCTQIIAKIDILTADLEKELARIPVERLSDLFNQFKTIVGEIGKTSHEMDKDNVKSKLDMIKKLISGVEKVILDIKKLVSDSSLADDAKAKLLADIDGRLGKDAGSSKIFELAAYTADFSKVIDKKEPFDIDNIKSTFVSLVAGITNAANNLEKEIAKAS